MSGKRLLDLIAVGQAVASVAKRSLPIRPGNLPSSYGHRPGTPSAAQGPSIFQKQVPDLKDPSNIAQNEVAAAADLVVGQSEPSDRQDFEAETNENRAITKLLGSDAQSSSNTGPVYRDRKTSEPLLLRRRANADKSAILSSTNATNTQEEPETAPQTQKDILGAHALPGEGSPAEIPYSQLFRSPRAADLLQARPRRPSAWANVHFHPPETSPEPLPGALEGLPDDQSNGPAAPREDSQTTQVRSRTLPIINSCS
jgi:hypothetical protein